MDLKALIKGFKKDMEKEVKTFGSTFVTNFDICGGQKSVHGEGLKREREEMKEKEIFRKKGAGGERKAGGEVGDGENI